MFKEDTFQGTEELNQRLNLMDDQEEKSTEEPNTGENKPESSEHVEKSSKNSREKKEKKSSNLSPNPYEEKFHSEFSFMSLVLGIFGLILPLFSVLAIIFGIGGLMQTHREHMKGKWMAIVGIVFGFLGIILIIVAIIFGIAFLQEYMLRFGSIETLVGNV